MYEDEIDKDKLSPCHIAQIPILFFRSNTQTADSSLVHSQARLYYLISI